MYYVYILKSIKTGIYYKGLTNNIERRFKQHLLGQVEATKHRLPLQLVHVELCENRKQARNLEIYFKSGFGREIIKQIECIAWVAEPVDAQVSKTCEDNTS